MRRCLKHIVLLVILSTLTTSCYFTSKQGLPKSPQMDQALLGMWETIPLEADQDKENGYLLFMEDTEGLIHIVAMEDYFRYTETYRGFISDINGKKYLNLKEIRMRIPTTENYFIVAYEIKNNKILEISLLNEGAMEKAVAEKKIKGTLEKNQYTSSVVLTASPEELADFFGKQKQTNILDKKLLARAKKIRRLPKFRNTNSRGD